MIDLQMKSTDSFDRWHTEQTTCTGLDEPNGKPHERIKKGQSPVSRRGNVLTPPLYPASGDTTERKSKML